jgi:hypothetical protein
MQHAKHYMKTIAGASFVWITAMVFASMVFLILDEASGKTTKVIRQVKVISATVDSKSNKVKMQLENTVGEKWWHVSDIAFSDCPFMEYHKFKNVYITTNVTYFLRYQRYGVEGVVTFCHKAKHS